MGPSCGVPQPGMCQQFAAAPCLPKPLAVQIGFDSGVIDQIIDRLTVLRAIASGAAKGREAELAAHHDKSASIRAGATCESTCCCRRAGPPFPVRRHPKISL